MREKIRPCAIPPTGGSPSCKSAEVSSLAVSATMPCERPSVPGRIPARDASPPWALPPCASSPNTAPVCAPALKMLPPCPRSAAAASTRTLAPGTSKPCQPAMAEASMAAFAASVKATSEGAAPEAARSSGAPSPPPIAPSPKAASSARKPPEPGSFASGVRAVERCRAAWADWVPWGEEILVGSMVNTPGPHSPESHCGTATQPAHRFVSDLFAFRPTPGRGAAFP